MKPVRSHRFGKRRFAVSVEDRVEGYCQFGDVVGRDEIYIDPSLSPMMFLDRAVHEAAHACLPDAPEATIKVLGRDIARFLWRLGYRRSAQD